MHLIPFRLALSFVAILILAQGLADGFVLQIFSHGKMSLELESTVDNSNRQEKKSPSALSCEFDGSSSRYLDISSVEEFPPLHSTVQPALFPTPVFIGFNSLLTKMPLSKSLVLHRDESPLERSPLGPNPLATVRLTL